VFLQRKGNPHDIVFAPGVGPRLHHAAFGLPGSYHFFYMCDLAANMGFAANIECGPGRHGPGHVLFIYLRDPDGHRIGLFNTHYQCMDIENEPVRWDVSYRPRRWQLHRGQVETQPSFEFIGESPVGFVRAKMAERAQRVGSIAAASSVRPLSRLRGRGGEGRGQIGHTESVCPLPVPPPQAGEGTLWRQSSPHHQPPSPVKLTSPPSRPASSRRTS
jgi:hypothetical protein